MSSNPVIELTLDELRDQRRVWAGASGSHEEGLGRLALLTDERVLEAAVEEIQTGQRVGLNWSLAKSEYPGLGRAQCEPRIVSLLDDVRFDDIYKFNPRMEPNRVVH